MCANWNTYPQNEIVSWPENEKIIGVLGVAPLATSDFFQRLCSRPALKDWNHPRIIIDSNPKIPSRGRHLDLGEADPVPFMKESIRQLINYGAEIIAVPCNTAHIFYDRYIDGFDAIIPNIIEITSLACAKNGLKKVLVLASKNVIKYDLYHKFLSMHKIKYIVPDSQSQDIISDCIEQVKKFNIDINYINYISSMVKASEADGIILGCTELSTLFNIATHQNISFKFLIIDSSQVLADHCMKLINN